MQKSRWYQLMNNDELPLSQEELDEGWHWCPEWDDLLVGPEMGEWDACQCELPQLRLRVKKALEVGDNMWICPVERVCTMRKILRGELDAVDSITTG